LGTSLTTVVDLFLSEVTDWTLDVLYSTSGSIGLNTFVEPWLLNSINKFYMCDQDLTYTPISGSVDGYFTETLTSENTLILSNIMTQYWYNRLVNNVRQMNTYLTDKEFDQHSAANNMNAKLQLFNAKKEEVNQILTEYTYRKNDWTQWKLQNFV